MTSKYLTESVSGNTHATVVGTYVPYKPSVLGNFMQHKAYFFSRFSALRSLSSALRFLSFLLFTFFSTGVCRVGFAFGNLKALPLAALLLEPAWRLRHHTKPANALATTRRVVKPALGSRGCCLACLLLVGSIGKRKQEVWHH